MIAHLRGTLLATSPGRAIVDCHGVGYDVTVSMNTFTQLPEAGQEVSLFIHTHVREDQIALFGFHLAEEKALFEKLLSVSGIGPKLAVNILGGMNTPDLVGAIRGGDAARLTRMPGVGKKTAERMVLELKDKLAEFGVTPAASAAAARSRRRCALGAHQSGLPAGGRRTCAGAARPRQRTQLRATVPRRAGLTGSLKATTHALRRNAAQSPPAASLAANGGRIFTSTARMKKGSSNNAAAINSPSREIRSTL